MFCYLFNLHTSISYLVKRENIFSSEAIDVNTLKSRDSQDIAAYIFYYTT